MLESPADTTAAKIRIAAMDLLTGREYSRAELATKLNKRFDSHASIDEVLEKIAEEGLQSDKRFAEAFVRSRIYRGHGLARIRQDIRQKGVGDELVARALEEADIDWYALAKDVAKRKFGNRPAADQRDKARRMRFMQYRGFNYDQIKCALGSSDDTDEYID
ncbi:MAG: regulatory protein RecX [Porticoccaceae bacterium]